MGNGSAISSDPRIGRRWDPHSANSKLFRLTAPVNSGVGERDFAGLDVVKACGMKGIPYEGKGAGN